jgi:hypothetical protein
MLMNLECFIIYHKYLKTSIRKENENKRLSITLIIICLFAVIEGSKGLSIDYFKVIAQQTKEPQLQFPEIQPEPPQAMDIRAQTSPNTQVIIEFQTKDSNPDSQLTVSIVSDPTKGKLEDIDQTTRTVKYIPEPNFTGEDSFTYRVNNGEIDSNIATVFIKIFPQNNQTLEQKPDRGISSHANITPSGNTTSEY